MIICCWRNINIFDEDQNYIIIQKIMIKSNIVGVSKIRLIVLRICVCFLTEWVFDMNSDQNSIQTKLSSRDLRSKFWQVPIWSKPAVRKQKILLTFKSKSQILVTESL